jgi:hypothetical protein
LPWVATGCGKELARKRTTLARRLMRRRALRGLSGPALAPQGALQGANVARQLRVEIEGVEDLDELVSLALVKLDVKRWRGERRSLGLQLYPVREVTRY